MYDSKIKKNLISSVPEMYCIVIVNAVIQPRNYLPLRNFLIKNLDSTMWASSLKNHSHEDSAILRNAIVLGLMTTHRSHCGAPWAYPCNEHGIDLSGMRYVDAASTTFLRTLFGMLRLCAPGAQLQVKVGTQAIQCFTLTEDLTIHDEEFVQDESAVLPSSLRD